MQRNIFAAVLVVFMLFAVQEAWSQEEQTEAMEEANPGVFQLGVIEVVGKADSRGNGTAEAVTEQKMRLFNKNTLAGAANLVPGVTLNYGGARNELMLSVRGFDIKHVPTFQDGIPIYVPYDGYPDLGRFTTFDLSEVIVSKGFSSVLYGPNTMGGAINMISKRPVKEFEGSVGGGYATGETYNTYANLGSNQGKWYVQGSASVLDSNYFVLSDDFKPVIEEDGDERENSYRTDRKLSFKIGLTPRKNDEYAFSYISQHGEKGNPAYTGDDPSTKVRYWQWPNWDKESYYFNSNTLLGETSYIKTRLFYDMFDNALYSYDDDTYTTMKKKSAFKSWYDDHTSGGSLDFGTTLLPKNTIKTAFHYKRDVHKEHNEGDPEQRFEEVIFSLGIEDTVDISEQFYAIAGISYDQVNTEEAQDVNGANKIVDFEMDDTSAFNPQLGLFYKTTETGVAHISVAAKSRIPSIKDKYSYKMGMALPNPGLEPEKSINYEVGYEQLLFQKVKLEGAVFYCDISDYIMSVTIPDPDDPTSTLNQNQNVGDLDQYGLEIGLSGQFLSCLNGGINYSYFENEIQDSEEEVTDAPAHKIHAYLQYFPIKPLGIMVDAEYESERLSSSDAVRVAEEFFVTNAKVSYEVFAGFTAEAGVSNIFDEDYEYSEGYPEPGRSYFSNVRYEF